MVDHSEIRALANLLHRSRVECHAVSAVVEGVVHDACVSNNIWGMRARHNCMPLHADYLQAALYRAEQEVRADMHNLIPVMQAPVAAHHGGGGGGV